MISNLYEQIPALLKDELMDVLLTSPQIRIERIISKGHNSPKNFWYDQEQNEWILIIEGSAKIRFESDQIIDLKKGDYLNIPAHVKHRVEMTSNKTETIWLAIFY